MVRKPMIMQSPRRTEKRPPRNAARGLTLLEVLISIAVVSLSIMPLMVNLTNAGQNNTSAYVQSSRSMLLNSILDEMDPEQPDFITGYDMGTTKDSTTYIESGRPVVFLRRVDTDNTRSSSLKRRVYLYLYRNASDATNAPFYSTIEDVGVNDLYIDVGATAESTDAAGRLWIADANYNSANHVPGYVTSYGGTTGSVADDVLNTAAATDPIYRTYRDGADLRYTVDVEPGNYLVQLYFCEFVNTITATTPNRRRADIRVGSAAFASLPVALSNYNPKETMGNLANPGDSDKAHVLTFDVNVTTTRTINIQVQSAAGGTDLTPRLSGISIHRR